MLKVASKTIKAKVIAPTNIKRGILEREYQEATPSSSKRKAMRQS